MVIRYKNSWEVEERTYRSNSIEDVKEDLAYDFGDQAKFKIYPIPKKGKIKKYHVTAESSILFGKKIDEIVEAYNKKHAEYLAIGTKRASYIKIEEVK